ncbi:MAG TPA: hypothetical protein VGM90_40840 [Kofleriaceae bacterium]|jgi:hypothetical protein
MRKTWLGVLVVTAIGCGGGGNGTLPPDGDRPDANSGSDHPLDAGHDADDTTNPPVNFPDANIVDAMLPTGACNPLAQTGCNAGEKCTWIEDQDNPPVGHIGCAVVGSVPLGGACADSMSSVGDDCVKGSYCLNGTCKQVCDLGGAAPSCGSQGVCQEYSGLFDSSGSAYAGVCELSCDPLTQRVGTTEACGSPTPSTPTKGCYGYGEFSCAPVPANTLTRTDRQAPSTNASGNPYLNGCAPGFIPFFYDQTGSTVTLCSGTCAALEIDNTAAHSGNQLGSATALGKLPTGSTAVAGNSTCATGKKGSLPSSTCVFMWTYVEDDNGDLPAAFTPWADKLGVCMAISQFKYDANGDGTAETPYPACATLPPRSAATPGDFDDAADFGCQLLSHSQLVGNARVRPAAAVMTGARISRGTMEITRHDLL